MLVGMTVMIYSVSSALEKLNKHSIETYGRPPLTFVLGAEEFEYYCKEQGSRECYFKEIPIEVVRSSGVDFLPPRCRP